MDINPWAKTGKFRRVPSLIALSTLLMVACGTEAPSTQAPDSGIQPLPTRVATQNTPTPAPSPIPDGVITARDTVVFVTNEQPTTVGAASSNCGGNIKNTICDDLASDPLTWIDNQKNFQLVGLTGIEDWKQLGPDRWRFRLREGVTFHNGAPWNATQAKFWIDFFGDEATVGHFNSNDFSLHGVIRGEIVDALTLDVKCGLPCPILPRTTIYTKFQDVGWFEEATAEDIERMTVGLGPYKIVEWRTGIKIELEAFEDYKPNPGTVFAKAPSIRRVIQIWRNEALVRAAMLAAGEADWAEISVDDRHRVPKWKAVPSNQVFRFSLDTIHDPELRKVEVREALNLAVDCEGLLTKFFDGLVSCYANIAPPGTVGITPKNSAPYPFNPERARQLLEEADYDPAHQISLKMRRNKVPKDLEFAEAVVSYWKEVGINVELRPRGYRSASRSNCSHQRTREEFDNAAGETLDEKCRNLGPGPPNFASMQITAAPIFTKTLDYSRQGYLRNSCFSRLSGICEDKLEMMLEEAAATPTGDLRRQRIEALADHVHEHFHFVQGFHMVSIYGFSENLMWEPHYSPRIRANTMFFTQ